MKKQALYCTVLAAALLLAGCGGSAAADAAPASQTVGAADAQQAEEQPTAAPTPDPTPEPTPTPEPEAAPAQTTGERVYTLDADFMLLDANAETGWVVASWLSKGYGTEWYAVNPALGVEIEGEEGAEVALCPEHVVQFQWRDAAGSRVSAMDMFYYTGDTPQEMTLYATIYDLDGNQQEERELLKMTQSADDPYYSTVYPAMQSVLAELGGTLQGNGQMLTATDDGGSAVVTGADGAELLRIPDCDASMTYAFSAGNGSYVSVYRPDLNKTEIYHFAG